jgi:hypothetical protein
VTKEEFMKVIQHLFLFIADEILRLKRFISPVNGKRISKKQFTKETKFLEDTNFMFQTIEDTLFQESNTPTEDFENDCKYFELTNQISIEGEESLSELDREWLKLYVQEQESRWK